MDMKDNLHELNNSLKYYILSLFSLITHIKHIENILSKAQFLNV